MRSTSKYPVLMLPMRMETRFVKIKALANSDNGYRYELWIRVFPDQPFVNGFNPTLSPEEKKDKALYGASRLPEDWKKLVSKYGQYRAAWIRDISDVDAAKEEKLSDFIFKWLPDYFKAYLYWRNEDKDLQFKEVKFNPIEAKDKLSMLDPADNWLVDFSAAEKRGLARRVECPVDNKNSDFYSTSFKNNTFTFERIILVGIKREEIEPSSTYVQELLKSHQYSDGFSFLDYGTPTNNQKGEKSGYSSQDRYDATGSYDYAVTGIKTLFAPKLSTEDPVLQSLLSKAHFMSPTTHGLKFASALGFDSKDFYHIKNASHYESPLGKLIQKASWFALGGEMLQMLLGDNINNEFHEHIWNFFADYVEARGPYPTIKIGKLPYGILPVFHLRNVLTDINQNQILTSGSKQDKLNLVLAKLFEKWLTMAKSGRMMPNEIAAIPVPGRTPETYSNYVPRMGDIGEGNRELELARILSMEPHSTRFHVRMMELERVPAWYTNLTTTPQSIYIYPLLLIDELLKDASISKDVYKGDLTHAISNFEKMEGIFGAYFKSEDNKKGIDGNTIQYAPVSSFTNVAELPLENLSLYPPEVAKKATVFTFNDEWYKTSYLSALADILKKGDKEIIWYQGELSILSDLLLRGYTRGVQLYYRDIYLTQTKEQINGASAYKVTKRNIQVGMNVVIGQIVMVLENNDNPKKTIEVKAPFSGKIESYFYNVGEVVGNDLRLFRLKDEVKFNEMRQEMVSIGAQIILEIDQIKATGQDHVAAQDLALAEALDLNSYRLDAWLTGIAAQRIDWLRKGAPNGEGGITAHPNGFYFGAYSWVENLAMNPIQTEFEYGGTAGGLGSFKVKENDLDGGIIHSPSPAQAVAASMFRQSFSTYKPQKDKNNQVIGGSPFTLNLSSDRMQQSKQFMEGLRQGQSIEALLGFRFERFLHDNKLDTLIYDLRKQYPLTINKVVRGNSEVVGSAEMTVIDGLSILKARKQVVATKKELEKGLDLIADILDGSADLLMYEAGYQMTQGNFSQAAAAMDAAKGAVEPPKVKSIDTLIPGSSQLHKLALCFEAPKNPPKLPGENPKAYFEPTLEQWLVGILGDFSKIGCQVKLFSGQDEYLETVSINLAELKIGALDFLQLSTSPLNNGASELEQRIMQVVPSKYLAKAKKALGKDIRFELMNEAPNGLQSLGDAVEVLRYVQALLRESTSIKSEDIASNTELNVIEQDSKKIRYDETYTAALIEKIKLSLLQLKDAKTTLSVLALYDLQNAKGALYGADAEAENRARAEALKLGQRVEAALNKLTADTTEKRYYTKVEELKDLVAQLFGKSFVLIPPFVPTDAFKTALKADQSKLVKTEEFPLGKVSGGQERILHWIEGRAAVDLKTETFSDFLLLAKIWQKDPLTGSNPNFDKWKFSIAQYTKDAAFPWISLDETEIQNIQATIKDVEYPSDATAIVVFKSNSSSPDAPLQYGLMIDQFSEFIPRKAVDSGLAFQYNAPNNEAPQAWLLAAPSNTQDWDEDALRDILYDTIDLAKVRMVDLDAMKGFGNVLPMTYWFNIPEYLKTPLFNSPLGI